MKKAVVLTLLIIMMGFGCTSTPTDESATQPSDEVATPEQGESREVASTPQPSSPAPTATVDINKLVGTWVVDAEGSIEGNPEMAELSVADVEELYGGAKLIFTEDIFKRESVEDGKSGQAPYTIISEADSNVTIQINDQGNKVDFPIVFVDSSHIIFANDPFVWKKQ